MNLSVALTSLRTGRSEKRSYSGHASTCQTGKRLHYVEVARENQINSEKFKENQSAFS